MPLATIDISGLDSDGDTVAFDYIDAFDRPQQGFAIHWKDKWYAYQNLCPHWSTPLDEHGDELFDASSGVLVCATHGAMFEPHSGECISGPCMGESLRALRVKRVDDRRVAIYRDGLML